MKPEDILDDDAFSPDKLFDTRKYSTLIVHREGFSKKENDSTELVASVLDPNAKREDLERIYTELKEKGAVNPLIAALQEAELDSDKAKLLAACWESGLDFSPHFEFFTVLACHPDYSVAMEALTVLENCDGPIPEGALKQSKSIIEKEGRYNAALISILKEDIEERLNNLNHGE